MSRHWFKWFPGDYQRDTNHLSFVQDAAYRRLLDAYHSTGKLSANADDLLRVCRAITPEEQAAVRKVAAEFFRQENGRLIHDRVEASIAESLAITAKRVRAGQQGAAVTNGRRSANAAPNDAAKAAANAEILPGKKPSIPEPEPESNSEANASGGKPPASLTPDEIIFNYGVPLLTNAGTTEKHARSFLGGLRKQHGDSAVIDKLRECLKVKPLQPIEWLAAALPPPSTGGSAGRRIPARDNYDNVDYGKGGKL